MDYTEWMERARIALDEVPSGCKFEAKQLFPAHEWEALSRGDRIRFGTYFSNEYKDGRIGGIAKIERGKNNHTRYRKL